MGKGQEARGGALLIWGDVGFDDYTSGETLAGGCGLNMARAAVAAGLTDVRLGAPLGEDGEPLREAISALGLELDLIENRPGATPRQPITLREGERTLSGYQPGVLGDAGEPSAALREALAGAGLIYVPTFAQTIPWARAAWESGAPVALDLMDLEDLDAEFVRDAFARSRVLFAGLCPEHPRLPELRALAHHHEVLCVVTLGAEGALAWHGGYEASVAAAPVPGGQVVDTTGCGDTFAGTFLARWRLGDSLRVALEASSQAAARVAGRLGTS